MLVERKIYEVHRISVRGWRRSGQLVVEMEGWRQHEADWFKAMQGASLEISDPDFPGAQGQIANYIVSATTFQRKLLTVRGDNGSTEHSIFEGRLDITETWRSIWRKQAAEVINMGFKNFLLPVISALLSGLLVWWMVSPEQSEGAKPATPESLAEQQEPPSEQTSSTETSQVPVNFDSPRPSSPETEFHRRNSADIPTIGEPGTEGSVTNEHEGRPESLTNVDLSEPRAREPEEPSVSSQ